MELSAYGRRLRIPCALLAAVITAAWAAPAAAGEPVLYYTFDEIEEEKLIDRSGNDYHGRITGEPEKVPGGLRFGEGTCVIIPDAEAMNVGDGGFTLEMVIEIEPDVHWTANGVVIPVTADYEQVTRAWELSIHDDGHLRFNVRNQTGSYSASGSAEPLPVGKPVHIACVLEEDDLWDTMRRVTYINGKRQPHVQRGAAADMEGIEKITVGAQEPGTRHFRGIIRELRLYDRPPAGGDDPILERGRKAAED